MSKEENIKIFLDTCKQIENDKILAESTERAKAATVMLPEGYAVEYEGAPRYETPCKVVVSGKSTFEAARSYTGHVGVLNFASATNPGGGVLKGSSAQEEALCRCSNLYQCLEQPKFMDAFYTPHRTTGNALHNDDIIFTPSVAVIKNDAGQNLYRPSYVDVITCAAPNLRETPTNAYNHENGEGVKIGIMDLFKLHRKRANAILFTAMNAGIEHFITGAFGCGAFRNDPETVAMAWGDAVKAYRKCFKTIEFAVFCKGDTKNYDIFKHVLGPLEKDNVK